MTYVHFFYKLLCVFPSFLLFSVRLTPTTSPLFIPLPLFRFLFYSHSQPPLSSGATSSLVLLPPPLFFSCYHTLIYSYTLTLPPSLPPSLSHSHTLTPIPQQVKCSGALYGCTSSKHRTSCPLTTEDSQILTSKCH
jgi:hypothetical protein